MGGGFIEWKNYQPSKKGAAQIPLRDDEGVTAVTPKTNGLTIADVDAWLMRSPYPARAKTEINAFLDKIAGAMLATVKSGLSVKEGVLPGPIKLHSKAATVYERAMDDHYESDRAIALVSAFALAASEENARGFFLRIGLCSRGIGRKCARSPRDHRADRRLGRCVARCRVRARWRASERSRSKQIRRGLLAGAAVGYLCKHNATLAAAEGGCQAEIGVASGMAAALIAQAMNSPPQVIENAAELALEHHLGMTCDPVAGYVQVPCIERCAFGAVKSWIAYMIATNEIASRHRVDLDTTIKTLADTARDMHPKYKETSEAGLAANLVLC